MLFFKVLALVLTILCGVGTVIAGLIGLWDWALNPEPTFNFKIIVAATITTGLFLLAYCVLEEEEKEKHAKSRSR